MAWVSFFFPFCNFLYCVLICYHFLFLLGEGGVGFFSFLIIISYIFNKFFGTLFTF